MMHDFATNTTTAEVIEKELGMKPEEFDKKFLAAVECENDKRGGWLSTTGRKGIKEVAALAQDGENQQVIARGRAIRDNYPDYVEHRQPVRDSRADAFLALNDKSAAIDELRDYAKVGGRSPETLKKLAEPARRSRPSRGRRRGARPAKLHRSRGRRPAPAPRRPLVRPE